MTLFVALCEKKCLRRYQWAMRLTGSTNRQLKIEFQYNLDFSKPRFFNPPENMIFAASFSDCPRFESNLPFPRRFDKIEILLQCAV